MTTATRSVAVVATRLPQTDRRALSQAWFSAFHLAAPSAGAPNAHRSPIGAPACTAWSPSGKSASAAPRPAPAPTPARRVSGLPATPVPDVERRLPAAELTRRIARALERCAAAARQQPASIAVNAGDGRVHLLLRTDGTTTRIVALCAPHLRERVDRALAQARFALAASGTRIEVAS